VKGVLSLVFSFVVISALFLAIFFAVNPMLLKMNTEFSASAEDIINSVSVNFTDSTTQQSYEQSIDRVKTSLPQSSEIISYSIKYAWLLFLLVTGVIIYIFSRKLVEVGDYQGGGLQ